MTIIYKLSLTAREAAVVYSALTKVEWFGADAEAELYIRTSIEKIGLKKTGLSLHDLLVETGAVYGREKPDIRTAKEKAADLKARHKEELESLLESQGQVNQLLTKGYWERDNER
tara:strand:+ start:1148 stop:1492 length:345 start_codon:yes stop_codon:yes gene_type:complete